MRPGPVCARPVVSSEQVPPLSSVISIEEARESKARRRSRCSTSAARTPRPMVGRRRRSTQSSRADSRLPRRWSGRLGPGRRRQARCVEGSHLEVDTRAVGEEGGGDDIDEVLSAAIGPPSSTLKLLATATRDSVLLEIRLKTALSGLSTMADCSGERRI